MKQTFTFFILFFAFILCGNAQTLLNEGFESGALPSGWTAIDSDGDGFNWDATLWQNPHSGNRCIVSSSYDLQMGPLLPDNWLITPAILLTGNATLSFYISGDDPTYNQENYSVYISTTGTDISDFTTLLKTGVTNGHYELQEVDLSAFTGQTVHIAFRHHDVTDMYYLKLDDVTISAVSSSPYIEVLNPTLDFGYVSYSGLGTTSIDVTGYTLSNPITASTNAPFSVSSDSITFGNTATLPTQGGKLYVRYTPTQLGEQTGSVTLSSTGANNVSIALQASSTNCESLPLPYIYNFDNEEQTACWTTIDVNGDAANTFGEFIISPADGFAVYGFSAVNAADDWLISPSFVLGERTAAEFKYSATADGYGYVAPERYEVYVIPTGQTYQTATLVLEPQLISNTAWWTQQIDLSAFAGQTLQVAFHVISDANAFIFGIKDFRIENDIVGISEHEMQTNIYPNPAKEAIHISASSNIREVNIYGLSGQLMGSLSTSGLETTMDISHLANGMYILGISTDEGISFKKFTVAR